MSPSWQALNMLLACPLKNFNFFPSDSCSSALHRALIPMENWKKIAGVQDFQKLEN